MTDVPFEITYGNARSIFTMRRHNSVVVEHVKLNLRNNVPKQFFEVSPITDGAWTKNHAVRLRSVLKKSKYE